MFHALRLGPRVVVPVPFHEVDCAPNAETGSERHDESLEDTMMLSPTAELKNAM